MFTNFIPYLQNLNQIYNLNKFYKLNQLIIYSNYKFNKLQLNIKKKSNYTILSTKKEKSYYIHIIIFSYHLVSPASNTGNRILAALARPTPTTDCLASRDTLERQATLDSHTHNTLTRLDPSTTHTVAATIRCLSHQHNITQLRSLAQTQRHTTLAQIAPSRTTLEQISPLTSLPFFVSRTTHKTHTIQPRRRR